MFSGGNVLISLFIKDVLQGRSASFVCAEVLKNLSPFWTFKETILPLPTDAPPEFPRIILNGTEAGITIEIFPTRVNIRAASDVVFDIVKEGASTFSDSNLNFEIHRIGLVIGWVHLTEKAQILLKEKFLNGAIIDNPEDLQFSFLEKKVVGNFKVNVWNRFSTGISIKEPKEKVLTEEFDVNTQAEDNIMLGKQNLIEFLEKGCELILASKNKVNL